MAVLLSAMVAVPASAYEKSRFVTKGKVASLSASLDDECSSTYLYLTVSDEIVKDGSGKTKTRSGFVSYYGRDWCLDATWGGNAEITALEPLNLNYATFSFAFDVQYAIYDQDPIQQKLVGTVRLDANGDAEKRRETVITIAGDQRIIARSSGTMRDAVAAINVKVDGKKVNFAPAVGTLGTSKDATIEVTKF